MALFAGLMYWILVVMTQYGGLNWALAGVALFFFAFYLGCYLGIFCCVVSFLNREGIRPLLAAPWSGPAWSGCAPGPSPGCPGCLWPWAWTAACP